MSQAAGVHGGPGMRAERGPVWLGHGRRGARQDWSGGRGKGGQKEDQAASFKPCSRL